MLLSFMPAVCSVRPINVYAIVSDVYWCDFVPVGHQPTVQKSYVRFLFVSSV